MTILTAKKAAETLGITRQRVSQLVKSNKLKPIYPETPWLFSEYEILKRKGIDERGSVEA